jgi:hypothetical protein
MTSYGPPVSHRAYHVRSPSYLTPGDERVHAKDVGVASLLVEVCILDTVASIREGQPSRVRAELLHGTAHGEEVTLALAHLLAVHHQMPVRADVQRPVLLLEDSGMCVHTEGKVIRDEVLAGRAQVHRIEVLEVVLHAVGLLLRDSRALWPRSIAEDVLKEFVRELVGGDAHGTRLAAVNDTTYPFR